MANKLELLSIPKNSVCLIDNRWETSVNTGKPAGRGATAYAVPTTEEAPGNLTQSANKSPIPDSGTRTNFSTGAVRDAAPGKGLFSRIPPIAMRRLAKRFEDGAIKYPDGESGPNWMQGIPLSRFFDAIQRHGISAAEGKTDEDHLAAVLWNASAWAWTENEINDGRLPVTLNDLPFHPAMVANRHIRDVFNRK